MKRFPIIVALLLIPCIGCLGFRPTGVLAEDAPPNEAEIVQLPPDLDGMPKLTEGPPPPAPTHLVNPADITAENHREAVERLKEELERDRKAADDFPNYSKVSHVKRSWGGSVIRRHDVAIVAVAEHPEHAAGD